MSDLYRRILLWHKLVAMQTGGLALCSAKRRLNRDEAKGWSAALRNVADEIDEFLSTGTFILDDMGQRMVQSDTGRASTRTAEQEVRHVDSPEGIPKTRAVSRKAGGLRIATRKKQ